MSFNPSTDIPDLTGKRVFITGGTNGLGCECILQLAKHNPSHIYFTGRKVQSAEKVLSTVKSEHPSVDITFYECDLGSLNSVNEVAEKFVNEASRLDILMCNAGIMAETPELTTDGYELNFGINHVGHALLIKKLLPVLLKTAEDSTADVRLVILSSLAFLMLPSEGISFKIVKTLDHGSWFGWLGSWRRYGQSKLANLLYARELARRYPSITTVSVHPGIVATAMLNGLSWPNRYFVWASGGFKVLDADQGAHNQLWACVADKGDLKNGGFYEPIGKLSTLSGVCTDSRLAAELWDWTEEELEPYSKP